jgi:hypothetical protein
MRVWLSSASEQLPAGGLASGLTRETRYPPAARAELLTSQRDCEPPVWLLRERLLCGAAAASNPKQRCSVVAAWLAVMLPIIACPRGVTP